MDALKVIVKASPVIQQAVRKLLSCDDQMRKEAMGVLPSADVGDLSPLSSTRKRKRLETADPSVLNTSAVDSSLDHLIGRSTRVEDIIRASGSGSLPQLALLQREDEELVST